MNDTTQTAVADTSAPVATPQVTLPEGTTGVNFNFRTPQASVQKFNTEEGLPPAIKRASVTVGIKLLTINDVVDIINSGDANALSLIVEQANSVLISEVRAQLDDLPNYEEVNLALLDMSKVDFIAIANQPKALRNGGISDEMWEEWQKDFAHTFATTTDHTPKQVDVVHTLLTKKLKDIAKAEDVLRKVDGYLQTWFVNTTAESQEKYAEIYKRLAGRIETYLGTVNEDQLAKLGI